jgi:hypothetical protein
LQTAAAIKCYAWIPANQPAPKDITSNVDLSNIVEGSRQRDKDLPDLNIILDDDFPELSLTEKVTINNAMNDEQLVPDWSNTMATEFSSLQQKNTGLLVPPPSNDKIIGGMWLLNQKKNEFNEIICHKAR